MTTQTLSDMQTLGLDFIADDTLTGFRLLRLEVLNWGSSVRLTCKIMRQYRALVRVTERFILVSI